MEIFFGIFVFIFGAIIGSFLNVVILRFGTGITLGGRSKCFSCSRTLSVSDLFPIVSYIFLLGKCRGCKSKISIQYPLVEFITAALFLITFLVFGNPDVPTSFIYVAIYWIISAILVVISVYDFKHKIIPNEMVYPFIAVSGVALILSFFIPGGFFGGGINGQIGGKILDILAGPALWFFPFYLVWFLTRGKGMGFADSKLAWGMGWALGLSYGISAVCFSFWIGALFSLLFMLLQRIYASLLKSKHNGILKMKSEIPFAPYLIVGFFIVLFTHINVLDFVNMIMSYF